MKCKRCKKECMESELIDGFCKECYGKQDNGITQGINIQLISYLIAIVVVIVIGIFIKNWWNGLDSGGSSKDDDKIDAYVMSQDFMKDYLTNSSSAKYPMYNKITVIQTGDRYKVKAYVESKNKFNSQIRNDYTMILQKERDGGWTKISCDVK